MLLPLVVMAVLGVLRVRVARVFWRKLYIVGLVYVALILARLALTLW